jgi:hypothetical protein
MGVNSEGTYFRFFSICFMRLIPAPDHWAHAATSIFSSVPPATTTGIPCARAIWVPPYPPRRKRLYFFAQKHFRHNLQHAFDPDSFHQDLLVHCIAVLGWNIFTLFFLKLDGIRRAFRNTYTAADASVQINGRISLICRDGLHGAYIDTCQAGFAFL